MASLLDSRSLCWTVPGSVKDRGIAAEKEAHHAGLRHLLKTIECLSLEWGLRTLLPAQTVGPQCGSGQAPAGSISQDRLNMRRCNSRVPESGSALREGSMQAQRLQTKHRSKKGIRGHSIGGKHKNDPIEHTLGRQQATNGMLSHDVLSIETRVQGQTADSLLKTTCEVKNTMWNLWLPNNFGTER